MGEVSWSQYVELVQVEALMWAQELVSVATVQGPVEGDITIRKLVQERFDEVVPVLGNMMRRRYVRARDRRAVHVLYVGLSAAVRGLRALRERQVMVGELTKVTLFDRCLWSYLSAVRACVAGPVRACAARGEIEVEVMQYALDVVWDV